MAEKNLSGILGGMELDRVVRLPGVWSGISTGTGVLLALLLVLMARFLHGRGRPFLADLSEHMRIWERQVGDCCHCKETLEWLAGAAAGGGAATTHLTKGAAGRPKGHTPFNPDEAGTLAPRNINNYMDLGVLDRLGADVKQDMEINN